VDIGLVTWNYWLHMWLEFTPHQDKVVSSIVVGRAVAEETGALMPGESHYVIHNLIQFQGTEKWKKLLVCPKTTKAA